MELTLGLTVYCIYILISTIDSSTSNYIGERCVCSVCDVFSNESKLKFHIASDRHAKYVDMLSVLDDANNLKEVASEPFEFEELCSEESDDSDKFHIILHMSRLAWFQDESVLAQLGLSNRVRSVPTQAMCRLIVFCKFLKMTREYQGKEDACGPSIRKKAEVR